jgi:hypothetical protein
MQTRVDNFWRVPLRQAYIRVKRGKYRIAIPHSESAQYTLSISRLAANQAVIDVGRDIDILPIFSPLWPQPY